VPTPQAAASAADVPDNCPEDLDEDGLIGVGDVLITLSAYGCVGTDCISDFDGDNVVGVSDVLELLSAFSTICF